MQKIINLHSRTWPTLATLFHVGWTTVAVIILLISGQPEAAVATGGCSAPDGACSTVINS